MAPILRKFCNKQAKFAVIECQKKKKKNTSGSGTGRGGSFGAGDGGGFCFFEPVVALQNPLSFSNKYGKTPGSSLAGSCSFLFVSYND